MPRGNGTDKKQQKRYRSTGLLVLLPASRKLKGGTEIDVALECNCLGLSREKSVRALIYRITNQSALECT